ncbi:HNH endonuclease [Variovorax sp. YR566]|uniref:HNH endonuclease n=1 Tax=Variovorax sp. YR566 TaxID=3450237 RepID=UPI003F81C0BF
MFVIDQQYTRAAIRQLLGVEGTRGGKWDTGHARHDGEHFIFCNIDIAGRTGHNYNNFFEGEELVWHPREGAKLTHPAFGDLVSGTAPVHVFFRLADHDPFTYAGVGSAVSVQDTIPIEVRWGFPDKNTHPDDLRTLQGVVEGAKKQVTVNAYERDPTAKPRCIKRWGTICTVCDFDFGAVYGELGAGFIHVHHLKPIHTVGAEYLLDPENDLRPVCPNCHSMLHRRKEVLSIDELVSLLRRRFNGSFTQI